MKKILFTALGLILALSGNAQKLDNGLLWKISGNGLSKPSYLFGTMHATCDATLAPNVMAALDATKQLYLELDMDDPSLQTQMMAGMAMKDGLTMSKIASPEDYKTVDAFLQANLGVSAYMVDTFKPLVVSSMLIAKMTDCPIQSYELELMKITQMQQEEVYGLETVADQFAVFDAIPYKEQMTDLVKTALDNMANGKAEMQKMMTLYKNKDLNELYTFIKHDGNPLFASHMDVLLNNRNQNWIPKIEKIAKEKPTFFGVGAAHLAGEDGVIMLLRKKGYKVEAVK